MRICACVASGDAHAPRSRHRAHRALSLLSLPLLAALGAPCALYAQAPVGFRSGFTEGLGVPPRGRVDVDYGASIMTAGATRGVSAGEVTAHVPITRRVGVRFHLNSYEWVRTPQATITGRDDMGIGGAVLLRDIDGWRPSAALLVRVDVPSGSLPGRGNAWRPSAKAALQWRLPAGLSVASNIGVAMSGAADARDTQRFGSLWLGRALTSRVGSFTEMFAFDHDALKGPSTRSVRAGVTILVTNSLHLDVNASTQLGASTARRTLGLGVKHRL